MNYDPNQDNDDTSSGERNDTDEATTQEGPVTDKSESDKLSQPGAGVQYEEETIRKSIR